MKEDGLNPIETVWGWDINGEKTAFSEPFLCAFSFCHYYAGRYAILLLDMAFTTTLLQNAEIIYPGYVANQQAEQMLEKESKAFVSPREDFCLNMRCSTQTARYWKVM